MKYNMNRRQFLTLAVAGAGVAAVGGMAGCSDGGVAGESNEEVEIAESLTADIVIVGGGMSGLAAAVQAGLNGDKVILLEASGAVGGSGVGVEGLFGHESKMAKEQGITFDYGEAIQAELRDASFGNDGSLWRKEIEASGANIDWLVEQGVKFSGLIDAYEVAGTAGLFPSFHWFEGGYASVGYVPPMEAKAKELGVEIMLETRATELIFEDDVLAGVIALRDEKGIEIKAPAVILASGGYAENEEVMRHYGINTDRYLFYNAPRHMGDGRTMALNAGAAEFLNPCFEGIVCFENAHSTSIPCVWLMGAMGPVLWVNQDAQRFVNEDCGSVNMELPVLPVAAQREAYAVITRDLLVDMLVAIGYAESDLDDYINGSPESIFEADNIYDLSEKVGIDSDAFRATVDEYARFCENGKDEIFGKDPQYLVPLENGPFYIIKLILALDINLGTIKTDHECRVITETREPIPGLYATGADGCMLYRDVYTIDVCGTACMNSVWSGRTAANHAHGFIA